MLVMGNLEREKGKLFWLTWTMCDHDLTLVVFKAKLCGFGRRVPFLVQNVDFELLIAGANMVPGRWILADTMFINEMYE